MSDNEKSTVNVGAIEWCDLTVDNAEKVKDFYCDVVVGNQVLSQWGNMMTSILTFQRLAIP